MKNKRRELKQWAVNYRATYSGTAVVEAETAEEARALVVQGDFEDSPDAERIDWEPTGSARLD